MSDIRIDLEAIQQRFSLASPNMADYGDLIAEVKRLSEVNDRWSGAWKTIVHANAEAHAERIQFLEKRVEMLEKLL